MCPEVQHDNVKPIEYQYMNCVINIFIQTYDTKSPKGQ